MGSDQRPDGGAGDVWHALLGTSSEMKLTELINATVK